LYIYLEESPEIDVFLGGWFEELLVASAYLYIYFNESAEIDAFLGG